VPIVGIIVSVATKKPKNTISMSNEINNVVNANLAEALGNLQSIAAQAYAAPVKYKIEIADRTGHTTVADLTLDQAVGNILDNAENNARWVFINGSKFEFEGANYRDGVNVSKLKAQLEAMVDPAVLLTGVLVGGSR
jgi:hypothetical protein